MRYISIIGCTGSIGRQALEVIRQFPTAFRVVGLAAGSNRELLLEQVRQFQPGLVSLKHEADALWLKQQLTGKNLPEICWGRSGLLQVAENPDANLLLTAVSGAVGLEPTCAAIRRGKQIALANKETLVAAGAYVTALAKEFKVDLLPVDSEHSAIWQCLQGEKQAAIDKLILTASGGPFRSFSRDQLKSVTPQMALKHPNWQMGAKITIDSATLMNKGLEVIEAHWLFEVDFQRIEVLVHPQSVIHSMVQLVDGSVLAHLGVPDMRIPIQYAFSHPGRWPNQLPRLDFTALKSLTFERPDLAKFPALALAFAVGEAGGVAPAVMNAANEVAVQAFLKSQINFLTITDIVRQVLEKHDPCSNPALEDILAADQWARQLSQKLISDL